MSKTRTIYNIRSEQMSLPFMDSKSFQFSAGRLRRAEAVREAVTATLKDCHLSPEQIADEMSRLTGDKVTKHHLANWSAESKSQYRMPLEWAAAFSVVTNDNRVVKAALEGSGINVLDDSDIAYYEIGKAMEEKRESEAKIKEHRNRIQALRMQGK